MNSCVMRCERHAYGRNCRSTIGGSSHSMRRSKRQPVNWTAVLGRLLVGNAIVEASVEAPIDEIEISSVETAAVRRLSSRIWLLWTLVAVDAGRCRRWSLLTLVDYGAEDTLGARSMKMLDDDLNDEGARLATFDKGDQLKRLMAALDESAE